MTEKERRQGKERVYGGFQEEGKGGNVKEVIQRAMMRPP